MGSIRARRYDRTHARTNEQRARHARHGTHGTARMHARLYGRAGGRTTTRAPTHAACMQSNTIGTTIGCCGDARTQPDSETNSEPDFENTLAKASGATAASSTKNHLELP